MAHVHAMKRLNLKPVVNKACGTFLKHLIFIFYHLLSKQTANINEINNYFLYSFNNKENTHTLIQIVCFLFLMHTYIWGEVRYIYWKEYPCCMEKGRNIL